MALTIRAKSLSVSVVLGFTNKAVWDRTACLCADQSAS